MDNWVIIKLFSYLRLRQSHVKQEVDMPQIQKCVIRYSSPYWCSVPNIRKLASVVPEKNVTEFFCDVDDPRRWIVIPICRLQHAYKRAGDTKISISPVRGEWSFLFTFIKECFMQRFICLTYQLWFYSRCSKVVNEFISHHLSWKIK